TAWSERRPPARFGSWRVASTSCRAHSPPGSYGGRSGASGRNPTRLRSGPSSILPLVARAGPSRSPMVCERRARASMFASFALPPALALAATDRPTGRGSMETKLGNDTSMKVFEQDIEEVLLTHEQIQSKAAELGAQISADYAGSDLLLVGVLKGAFVFMADLSRHVTLPMEFDFMAV